MRSLNFFFDLTVFCLLFSVSLFSETIDRIVAVVNEQVITLTDLRIVETFGLYDKEVKERAENPRLLIMERLIGQKLVIHSVREEVYFEKEELDSFLRGIIERMGFEQVERNLEEFGLNWDDLRTYIKEKIIYEKIISRKISQRIIVSLEEIEDYYRQSYVPSQKEKGLEPKPMMELLNEIESAIRQEKIKTQIEDWIKNLKKKADIQIKEDSLRQYS